MEIKPCTVSEIFDHPDATALLREYADECALRGLPSPKPVREVYDMLEHCGALRPLGAFEGERLMGIMAPIVSVNPHYGVLLVVVESFFVRPGDRDTGAGLGLLHAAEALERATGAAGLIISAPSDGKLAQVIGAMHDYRETNRVFFRGAHADMH